MVLCHIVGMDREIDLKTADRDVLIAIIVRQQAIIERLEKRIAQLEGQAKPSGSGRMPGLKPKADRKPAQPKGPRKPRPHGFARTRMTPTQRVEHAVAQCTDCGTQLAGGWTQRTREVIDLPQVPVQVTEHAYIARTCPSCQRRCVPPAQLDGVVLDKQRLGVNVMSLIAALKEEAAALPHHPVVPGCRPWAAPQSGSHRRRHAKGGSPGPGCDGRYSGTDPRQPGGPCR